MRALVFMLALTACAPQPASPAGDDSQVSDQEPVGDDSTESAAAVAAQTPQQALAAMPSWENARAAGVDFRAVGQEPGWLLDVYTRGIVKFSWDYGDNYAEFAIVEPTHPQEGVTRYEAHSDGLALVLTIRRSPCRDGMSGQPYPATVEVSIDGRTLIGCGRSV